MDKRLWLFEKLSQKPVLDNTDERLWHLQGRGKTGVGHYGQVTVGAGCVPVAVTKPAQKPLLDNSTTDDREGREGRPESGMEYVGKYSPSG